MYAALWKYGLQKHNTKQGICCLIFLATVPLFIYNQVLFNNKENVF
jgi:hypothetical protein